MQFTMKTEPECINYMKLLYKGNEYTLEQFSDKFKKDEFSLEKLLCDCTLIYKGTKIPFEEYIKQSNAFSRELLISEKYMNEIVPLEPYIMISNYDYYRAAKFLEKSEECLQIARYYLQASNDIIDYDCNLNWKSSYGGIFVIRAMNFKTAIIWYNNCFDYILQIVSLAFRLYELFPKYKSNWELSDILKHCDYMKISNICNNHSDNEYCIALLNILENCNQKMKDIRNWANYSKHRGGIDIIGLEPPPLFNLYKQNPDGKMIEIPIEFKSIELDLDKNISVLLKAHNALIKCINEIVDFIDFQGAVPKKDSNGKLIIPDKHSYVKIHLEH